MPSILCPALYPSFSFLCLSCSGPIINHQKEASKNRTLDSAKSRTAIVCPSTATAPAPLLFVLLGASFLCCAALCRRRSFAVAVCTRARARARLGTICCSRGIFCRTAELVFSGRNNSSSSSSSSGLNDARPPRRTARMGRLVARNQAARAQRPHVDTVAATGPTILLGPPCWQRQFHGRNVQLC